MELGSSERDQLVGYIVKTEQNETLEFLGSTPETADCLQSVSVALLRVISVFVHIFMRVILFSNELYLV